MKYWNFFMGTLLLSGAWGGSAGAHAESKCAWEQWGQNAGHGGEMCVRAQPARRELAHVTIDKFAAIEKAGTFDALLVHYQVPLNDDEDNVFVMSKAGSYLACDPPGSFMPFPCAIYGQNGQVWTEKRLHWQGDKLVEKWTFTSDWKPTFGWPFEPMFQPALSGPFIYVPGAGGSVWQVLKIIGLPIQRINPFPTIDPNTFVTGGVTPDRSGNLYWNVVHIDPATFAFKGYLVKATPWGTTKIVSYDDLTPDAPKPDALCYDIFADANPPIVPPYPPADNLDGSPALPPQFPCGGQAPASNVTPAIGPDGTIFTASRNNEFDSYVIAVKPNLELKWAASMRDLVHDGCGVIVPYGTGPSDCRVGADFGVDPNTNMPPAFIAYDSSSGSPVALPDGGVLYGAIDFYSSSRGHLLKFDRRGRFEAAFDFGWDITPAVYRHDGTYSVILKDNHYGESGPYFITQLDKDLKVEWKFQNTSTQSCSRNADGSVTCVDDSADHPNGFEWCINAPAVDRDGTVYVTSEDGNFYAIGQGGVEKGRMFLNIAEGAAYTPLSIDPHGRIYTMNNGDLNVLGR